MNILFRSIHAKLLFILLICFSHISLAKNTIEDYIAIPPGLLSGEEFYPNVMLVFDVSGSMHFGLGPENDIPPYFCADGNAYVGNGSNCTYSPLSRSSVARTAMRTVFASLRGRVNLGLMLYDAGVGGGDLYSPIQYFQDAHYTQITTQLNTINQPGAIGNASGTPIEGALRHTLDYFNRALPSSQNQTGTTPVQYIAPQQCPVDTFVILVTDGVPTVDPGSASNHQNACSGTSIACSSDAAGDLLSAGYDTYVVGFSGNTAGVDSIAAAGGTGPNAFTASNGDQLIQVFADIFGDIFERTSSFSGGTVLGSNASGAGVQIYPTMVPIRKDDINADGSGDNEVTWTGSLQSFFVDSKGFLRQNNNQSGSEIFVLNESVDRIFEFQSDRADDNRLKYADYGTTRDFDDLPGALIEIDDFNSPSTNLVPLWDASRKLSDQHPELPLTASASELNTYRQAVRFNRQFSTIPSRTNPGRHRYIFTCIDSLPNNPTSTTCSESETRIFEWSGNSSHSTRLNPSHRGYLLGIPDDNTITNGEKNAQARDLVAFIRGDESLNPDESYLLESNVNYASPEYRKRTLFRGMPQERHYLVGDIVHSNALQVGPRNEHNDLSYRPYRDQSRKKRNVVYVGANDGMLHAINAGFRYTNPVTGADGYSVEYVDFNRNGTINGRSGTKFDLGQEMWAYVPQAVLPHLRFLASPSYDASQHVYYVDGQISAFDVQLFSSETANCVVDPAATNPSIPSTCKYINGWGTILVATTRLGGFEHDVDTDNNGSYDTSLRPSIAILDVTDPESPPRLLAEISHDNLHATSSAPALVRDGLSDSDDDNWYLVFGSGPNDLETFTSDTRARVFKYQLDPSPGAWGFDNNDGYSGAGTLLATTTGGSYNDSFVGNMIARDWTSDGITDAVYFGTVSGTELAPDGDLRRIAVNDKDPDEISVIIDTNEPTPLAPYLIRDENRNNWVISHSGRFFTGEDWNYQSSTWMYGIREKLELVARGKFELADQNYTDLDGDIVEVATNLDDDDASLINVTGIEIRVTRDDADGNGEFSVNEVEGTLTGTLNNASSYLSAPARFEDLVRLTSGQIDPTILGWRKELQLPAANPNERFLQSPVTVPSIDAMQFTTYIPPGEACEVFPTGGSYVLSFITGTAFYDPRLFTRGPLDSDAGLLGVQSNIIIENQETDIYRNIIRGKPLAPEFTDADEPCINQFSIGFKSVDGSTSTEDISTSCTAPSRKSWVEIDLANF